MPNMACGWDLEIDRGPDWLFVRLKKHKHRAHEPAAVGEVLWLLLEQHSAHRLMLEMDQVETLDEKLIGQLAALDDRICEHGGIMRMCGMKPQHRQLLAHNDVGHHFAVYADRTHALLSKPHIPNRPR